MRRPLNYFLHIFISYRVINLTHFKNAPSTPAKIFHIMVNYITFYSKIFTFLLQLWSNLLQFRSTTLILHLFTHTGHMYYRMIYVKYSVPNSRRQPKYDKMLAVYFYDFKIFIFLNNYGGSDGREERVLFFRKSFSNLIFCVPKFAKKSIFDLIKF